MKTDTLVKFSIAAGVQRGRIVEVLPPGRLPNRAALKDKGIAMCSGGLGTKPRKHLSFVVVVRQPGGRKPIAYWPRTVIALE